MSNSVATSVTPDRPRRDRRSSTEMARSTDCTDELLRAGAFMNKVFYTPPAGSPERPHVLRPREGRRPAVLAPVGLRLGCPHGGIMRDSGQASGGAVEALEAEEAYVVACYAGLRQVGHDLTYDARELVAVSRAGRGERDLRVVRVQVYDEVVVRRVGEHAGLQIHGRSATIGEVPLGEVPQEPLVVVVRLAVQAIRIDVLFQVVVLAELEAGHAEDGEAVESTLLHEQIEDGEGVGPEALRARGLQPGQNLPLRDGEAVEHVVQLGVPGACRDDEVVRLVDPAVGAHAYAPFQRLPLQHALAGVDLGPPSLGGHHVGDDALLRREKAALGLDEREVVRGEVVAGVAALQLGAGQDLVGQVVQLARLPRALEDPGVLRAGVDGLGYVQEPLAGCLLDLSPQLVGAL